MKKINVAIIDDGIQRTFFKDKHNIEYYAIKNSVVLSERLQEFSDIPSHATTCLAIFFEFCNCYNKVYSIKIMKRAIEGAALDDLLAAMNWCIEHDIQLINISAGSTNINDFKKIGQKINELISKGVIVVAACSNTSQLTYPACMDKVIGVRCDLENKLSKGSFIYNFEPLDGIEITASCNYNLEILKKVPVCNSYATPFITAKVCEYMDSGIRNINDIKNRLYQAAYYINRDNTYYLSKKFKLANKLCWQRDIEVTSIVVVNECGEGANKVIKNLAHAFKRDEYNCVTLLNKTGTMNILEGSFRINNHNSENELSIKDELGILYNLTVPDVMLTFIYEAEDLQILKEENLIDVLVLVDIPEDKQKEYNKFSLNILSVNLQEKNVINDLYKRIIDLAT